MANPICNLTAGGREDAAVVLTHAVNLGLDFKLQSEIYNARLRPDQARDLLVSELPEHPSTVEDVLAEFADTVLPLCK